MPLNESRSKLYLLVAAASVAILNLCFPVACSRQPADPASKQASVSPPAAPAPPAIQLASGFKYSEDELTPDFPDVATIRLGERLRIYHRGPWTPSTIAFLDDQGNVVTSFRLDLPPRGTVSGTFPSGVAIANVRVTSAAEPFEVTSFDRCIGVNEPELSAERLEAMGVFQSGSSDRASAPSADAHLSRPIGVLSRETSLDPNFGRICLYAGTSSYSGVADEWKGTGPSTDAHWLDGRVRDAIRLSQVKQVK